VRVFWRRPLGGGAAVLWMRCDMCHWSGPSTRFVLLSMGQDMSAICDHQWCYGNPALKDQLRSDGWHQTYRHFPPPPN
jgi:hypothetical protein